MSRARGSSHALLAALVVCLAVPAHATAAAGDLIVANDAPTPQILRVNPSSGQQTILASGGNMTDPRGVAIAPNGSIYVADREAFGGDGGIIRVDPSTGAMTTVAFDGKFADPWGIAILSDAEALVADADANGGTGALLKVNLSTGEQSTISKGGPFVQPTGVVIANGNYYVVDQEAYGGSGGVIKVNPSNGAKTTLASGGVFTDPVQVAAISSGDLVVTETAGAFDGGVIKVSSVNGSQTTVASGGNFVDPFGIAVSAAGGLYVSDYAAYGTNGGIVAVHLSNGNQTTVASGGNFVDPFGIAVVTNRAPNASFRNSPNPANKGQAVTFDASASTDPDGSIAKYEWDFDGDGSFEIDAGTNPTRTHTFASGGSVRVVLRATDNSGATGTDTQTAVIIDRDTAPPAVRLLAPSRRGRSSLISRGVSVLVTSSEGGRVIGRLYLGGNPIGRSSTAFVGASAQRRIVVRLSKAGRRALRRSRRRRLVLTVSAFDAAGNVTRKQRGITLSG